MLTDTELERYSRQILLPELDLKGQELLRAAHVLVVGVGGLGSPVAIYLAAAGVGELTLMDPDRVDLSNLQRQPIHSTATVGQLKVLSAKEHLQQLNPLVRVNGIAESFASEAGAAKLGSFSLIVDCTDNFAVRFALNRFSQQLSVPLVSGAAIRFDGQVSVYDPRIATSPCYRCWHDEQGPEDHSCVNNGVLAPLVGLVGSVQASEAIKVITGVGESLVGRLLLIDALSMNFRTLQLHKDLNCSVCGKAEHPAG